MRNGPGEAACLAAGAALLVLAAGGRAEAQAGGGGSTQLEEISVEGQGAAGGGTGSNPNSPLKADGYVAKSNTSATKTATPLVEVPQSVSTVTRQQLDDRNVQSLVSSMAYTPGVRSNSSGFDPRFDTFYIRGFDATYDGIFRDGLREQNASFAIFKTEPYGLDGVSILKGPSSSLYGGGSPGGVVDLTTKRPTFTPFGEVQAQIGNNDRRQGQFDFGGPIGDSDTLAYRFTGVVRDSDTDVPGTPDDKVYLAPAFTWKPNDDTTLTVLSEYSRIRTGANLAYYNDATGHVTKIFSGDPSFNAMKQEQARIGYEFERKITPDVTFRQKFRYAHVDVDAEYIDILEITPGAATAPRGAGAIRDRIDSLNLDNQIEAKTVTGPVSHTLLAGFDTLYADYSDRYGYTEDVSPIKLKPLTYGGYIWAPYNSSGNLRQKQRTFGLYAQDQMKFDKFVLTLGARNDWVETKSDYWRANEKSQQNDGKLTGRAGLTYLGPWGINPYVSYATSFAPTLGSSAGGSAFVPTTGEIYEAGVKFAPPDLNLALTASVFDITQQNVVRTDPNNVNRSIQTGELRSKGFEFEATGSLARGLSFTGGYAYLEPEIVKGEPGTDGNQTSSIPKHSASLWLDYDFQPGTALSGLSVGGGARYTGVSFGDDENTYKNKAFLLFDASLKFDFERVAPRLKGVALQVNARNLANKDIATCEQGYCYRDEGRQVIASLKYRW
ncbi:TonB-dependent siderophore receptor [Methylopila sp. M107]|uniref:TonB-dependent siderophore receptor n=1 Tax=Methylopila sp. M107 TaxID=1101190 RepID=UPI000684FB5E|nr:TonB-dependent siderophore receptor [Methylopila sp. M107]